MTLDLTPAAGGSPLAPRPFQAEDIAAILAGWGETDRLLYCAATGLGKTVVFSHVLRERGGRGLVLVHRDELAQQAVEKLGLCWPGVDVGVVKAERNEVAAHVVVASVQTISRANRLIDFPPLSFETVVVDEAHHATATSYRRVLDWLAPEGRKVLGVTATPKRGDGAGLRHAGFETVVAERPILWGIQQGYLSDLTGQRVRIDVDLDGVKTSRGDYQDGALGDAMLEADAPEQIAAAVVEHANDRKSLVFTPTVAVAEAVAEELRLRGFPAEMVSGETPRDLRRDRLRRFALGEVRALVNCAVLTEGYDEPSVDCVVIARPTKSQSLYVQMVGRGTRRFPGKANCLVLDVIGATAKHSLITVATLAGLHPDAVTKRESLAAAVAAEEAREAARFATGRRLVEEVALFRPPDALFAWISISPTRHVIGLGRDEHNISRRIVLGAAPDNPVEWSSWVEAERRGAKPWIERVIAKRRPIEWAQGQAEDVLRRMGKTALVALDAPWRSKPVTDKQRAALARRGQAVWDGMTAGEASDLLDRISNRRTAR